MLTFISFIFPVFTYSKDIQDGDDDLPQGANRASRGHSCVCVWVGVYVGSCRVYSSSTTTLMTREETVVRCWRAYQTGRCSLSHTVSPWVLQLNMRCSVWPGWVLIKRDKDLSPVHGSMCCHSVRWRL